MKNQKYRIDDFLIFWADFNKLIVGQGPKIFRIENFKELFNLSENEIQSLNKIRLFRNHLVHNPSDVNLEDLNKLGSEVSPETLVKAGLISKTKKLKVLGNGKLEKPVTVKAHKFSESAKAAIEKAGGKIVMPKTSIGPNGFMAQFTDTEGNKEAFHSMK